MARPRRWPRSFAVDGGRQQAYVLSKRTDPPVLYADGRALLVQTCKDAYLYERRPGESWTAALERPPRWIDSPQLPQTEAACFDGRTLWVTTEREPAPLLRIPPAAPPD